MLLCALLVVDFADRQVVVTAFPYLRLALSEVQLAALVSAVSVVVPRATTTDTAETSAPSCTSLSAHSVRR